MDGSQRSRSFCSTIINHENGFYRFVDKYADDMAAFLVIDLTGSIGIVYGALDFLSNFSHKSGDSFLTDAMLIGSGIGALTMGAIIHNQGRNERNNSELAYEKSPKV
jgi:hypothetical protein